MQMPSVAQHGSKLQEQQTATLLPATKLTCCLQNFTGNNTKALHNNCTTV
jgi:hypothetical protein